MNEKELLDMLADQAPLPPADYPMTTLKRARRVRRVRALAIGGGALAVVALLLLTQLVLRPGGGGPSLPPAEPVRSHTGIVYLTASVTAEQRSAIHSTLDDAQGVVEVKHVSQEETYRRFAEMFKDAPDMVASVRPAEMPESFEFKASATADIQALLRRLRDLAGVNFASSPMPHEIPGDASPSHETMPVPQMGLPEAQLYAEQLILSAKSVWRHPAPPKTVNIVDGFCRHGKVDAGAACTQHRFSPLLRSELQRRVGEYAPVVFVDAPDGAEPLAHDALVVDLGPLGAHGTGDQTWWLEVRGAEGSEFARMEVAWNGARWVAGRWTAGSITVTPR